MGDNFRFLAVVMLFLVLISASCQTYVQRANKNQKEVAPIDGDLDKDDNQETEVSEDDDSSDDLNESGENLIEEIKEEIVEAVEIMPIVRIRNLGFDSTNLVINKGNKITFNNTDFETGQLHVIVITKDDNKSLRYKSPKLDYTESYVQVFTESGTYTFMDLGLKDEQEKEMYIGKILVK